jgi:hypothetical protein
LRADKAVAGVDAARIRVDRGLERIGIGALELGQLAPFEDEGGDFNPCPASVSSTDWSVEYWPLLPFLPPL